MSRLETAMERFSAALDALELRIQKAVAAGAAGANGHAAGDAEAEALRAERDRLQAEVERLGDECRALEDLTDQIAGRLDSAIDEIRATLEA